MKLSGVQISNFTAKVSPEFDALSDLEKQDYVSSLISGKAQDKPLEILTPKPSRSESLLSESNSLSKDKKELLLKANKIAEEALLLAKDATDDAYRARRIQLQQI
ncbi:MAG: hypothetical protein QNK36_00190 [Colwellia sp.]|nr:hypothetical protein [Colwellia sp.]